MKKKIEGSGSAAAVASAMKDNPELSPEFVKESLKAKAEAEAGGLKRYKRRSISK